MALKLEKLTLLIVEDTQPMMRLLVSVLETLGIKNVYMAANGEDAFRLFVAHNPDIIISDWQMSPMNGIEFTRMVRMDSRSPNRMVPIILLTGYSAWERVEEARDAGVTEFLVKPFTANDLARRLAYVVNAPRDFIETPDYFGPDRRRKKTAEGEYTGPKRRESDKKKNNMDLIFKS